MKGLIFSIEEFAVFDGQGIRVNVFFKGCPLRCAWCHNPEGWEHRVQMVKNPNGCVGCGACTRVCAHPEGCVLCGRCMTVCPMGLIRKSGTWIEAADLAARLLRYRPVLEQSGGGLTFSGGEVLMQPDFLRELLLATASMDRVLETSGWGDTETWRELAGLADFVYYDLKVMDPQKHRRYTGVDNGLILKNARVLFETGTPFKIRVPFIQGVNTDPENLEALCRFIQDAPALQGVELLRYNQLAGAKYKLLGLTYDQDFTGPSQEDEDRAAEIFEARRIPWSIQ